MQSKRSFWERWLAARIMLKKDRKPAKALLLIEQLEHFRPLTLRFQALKGELLLRSGQPEAAHDLLLQVRDDAKAREGPEGQYIRHYAQAWLARIRLDPFSFREQERKAAAISCSPRLKRFLWLPSGENIDPMNAEFDAWVRRNTPKDEDLRKRRI